MKIAQVIHGFPPENMAGAEVYTYNLAHALAARHEVHVFYRTEDRSRPEFEVRSREDAGLKLTSINNTFRFCDAFESTYRDDRIGKPFGAWLDQVQPDVVHVGHVICLSTTLIDEARARDIPVAVTLHDFWLFCPLGQLLKRDLTRCEGPELGECARCIAPKLALSAGVRRGYESLNRLPGPLRSERLRAGLSAVYRRYAELRRALGGDAASAQVAARLAHIRGVCQHVDRFIAPSRFLLEKFVEFGIPRSKLTYLDYGFDTAIFRRLARNPSPRLRFGYMGTLIPSKGLHVLVDAFRQLQSTSAELRIHAKPASYLSGFENYSADVVEAGGEARILWLGEFDNRDVASILAEIDVLIVPSIWYENSPLVIHEAFLAGVPVVASRLGGMAELVEEGRGGLLFRAGDSKNLAAVLQRLIDEPALLPELQQSIPSVVSIEQHASELVNLYRALRCTS